MKKPLFLIRLGTRLMPSQRREMREVIVRYVRKNGPRHWYGRGTLITHYAMSWRTQMSLCMRRVDGTSTEPPRTPIGITCPRCTRLRRRALKDWLAEPETVHVRMEGRARTSGGPWRSVVACKTCTEAADGTVVAWPCPYAPEDQGTSSTDSEAIVDA